MRIIGLAGWSGSGKTTLLTKVIPRIVERGKRVSTLKHAHHGFDLDQPGKDSHAHRAAGATEVLIASAKRWAVMHELRGAPEPALRELVHRLSPTDLVTLAAAAALLGAAAGLASCIPAWRAARVDPQVALRCE